MLNNGMLPWDYYQSALQDSQRGAALDTQMARFKTMQIRQQMLAAQQSQLLPMRIALMQHRLDPSAPTPTAPLPAPPAQPSSNRAAAASLLLRNAQDAIAQGADPADVLGKLAQFNAPPETTQPAAEDDPDA